MTDEFSIPLPIKRRDVMDVSDMFMGSGVAPMRWERFDEAIRSHVIGRAEEIYAKQPTLVTNAIADIRAQDMDKYTTAINYLIGKGLITRELYMATAAIVASTVCKQR